ncbi:Aldehyde dehydrogenase [Lachnellula suecica]|uniref:aldehyde dehydrogenase (NAD(+)) n=1 Tax=Lachnellula suecica TaxID=602035 RepID=A0A8T9C7G1_9HELO|nr:Aldehyde dehydrogenase [Lachnellula suecica]
MSTPTEYETRLFINNEYIESKSSETLNLVNPYDGSPLPKSIQVAGPEEIDLAVASATAAFKTGPWSTYTGAQRAKCLNKFADLLESHASELATLDAICMGGPVGISMQLTSISTAPVFRYYAGWADKIEGESFGADDGTYKIVRHEPLGVCTGMASWNAPLVYIGWKIAPALAAGNTYIYKASEKSPLSALALGKLVIEAGFPPGVLQFVSGAAKTGALLASHMKIQKISFTGSAFVGKIIQKLASDSNMKKVTLELGGKSPALVFADADIPNAVGSTADGFLFNSGEVCVATSRLYVQESIAPAFIDAVKARFQAATENLGANPQEATTTHGPMADEAHFNRVMSYIELGKKSAQTLIGGSRIGDKGFWIEPTIFLNPAKDSRIAKEEVFGPVLNIVTFKTEEEAIELANDTNTGLSAALYTSDLNRALRVSAKIEAGNVSINAPHFPSHQVPFGGFKESGDGKELGKYGLQSFLQTKSILINMKLPAKL